ncbi:periplasmic heavy metal sensor [Desulfosediminicola flagellatus]|uniref:periplasmic heavy metal sensor n=1 Tax=Desulfosediminicola flagellatus TaxID=2569541 RepID=UPI0010ABDDC5|nr:periplasmic heavy metal sensor [Desulfosediminicola flagellatus]
MKKKIIALVLVSGLAISTVASANWGRGGGGYNCGTCIQGQAYQQVDPAIQTKIDNFFTDTQAIRRDMAVKQAEKMALMRATNPDPAALSQVTGELFDLRATMQAKAKEAGVDKYIGPMGGRGPGGMGFNGKGGGPRGGGRMMMQNYQQ